MPNLCICLHILSTGVSVAGNVESLIEEFKQITPSPSLLIFDFLSQKKISDATLLIMRVNGDIAPYFYILERSAWETSFLIVPFQLIIGLELCPFHQIAKILSYSKQGV